MATLEEVLSKLSEEDKGVVVAAIESEKTKGIDESRKKGNEIKKHLTDLNKLKDTLKELELDPDGDLSEQISSLKTKINSGATSDEVTKQIKSLQKQVETLTGNLTEKERIAQEKSAKLARQTLTNALTKALGEKVYASEHVIANLIHSGKVKLGDDEETVLFVDGESELEFSKGVESFLKGNPGIVKNSQNPGGGSKPNNNSSEKTMARNSFDQLNPNDKMAFVKSGGQITD